MKCLHLFFQQCRIEMLSEDLKKEQRILDIFW